MRPSLLLVVLDTPRMDAVSAYGFAEKTTPSFDTLAREGLLYRWALAPAPWTAPSHATLFTSVGPDQHGVGIDGRMFLGSDACIASQQCDPRAVLSRADGVPPTALEPARSRTVKRAVRGMGVDPFLQTWRTQ